MRELIEREKAVEAVKEGLCKYCMGNGDCDGCAGYKRLVSAMTAVPAVDMGNKCDGCAIRKSTEMLTGEELWYGNCRYQTEECGGGTD